MSTYITKADYLPKITDKRLMQIVENDELLLDRAEATAISMVKDRLFNRYDTDTIFSLIGEDRHKQIVRYCVNIALYIIYERVPDAVTPPRIIKNYDDTILYLEDVSKGILEMNLPKKITSNTSTYTRIRVGSRKPRSH